MYFLIALIVIAIVAGYLITLKTKQTKQGNGLGFVSREVLFTPAERSFLGVLEQALDGHYRVFGKVRLGDIVKPVKGLSNSKRATAQNKINQKHVDFLVCSAADLAVVGVVELDDQSHGREGRAGRDDFVDRALNMAKIPVVRFSAKKGYVLQEVKARLAEIIPAAASPDITPKVQEAVITTQSAPEVIVESVPEQSAELPMPSCPKCGSVMVKRQASKGEHAGKWFWACSTFPKCRQVVAIGES